MNNRKDEKNDAHEGLFISSRHITMVVAGAIFFASLIFLGGYIVGKKHVMEQLVARLEQDSFADQVYSSLCELYDYDVEEEVIVADQDGESLVDDSTVEQDKVASNDAIEMLTVVQEEETHNEPVQKLISVAMVPEQPVIAHSYYAQLLSYHVKKYADNFVTKLAKKNIPAEVKTRKSTTARGVSKLWYQVVTKPYADREELQRVVDRISREEKVKGARIVTC